MESNLNMEDEVTIDSSKDNKDMNKGEKENESNNDNAHANTDEKENEVNEEKEDDGLDENNKKRVRVEDEGSSPTRKKVRNSPTKRKGRKNKIEKAKNYNRKYKKAKKCKDCEGEDEDKCILCGKSEHLCETEVNREEKKGHVWIWICKECSEIMGDEGVMEEMKEVVKREKERKRNIKAGEAKEKIDYCGLCEDVINKRQVSVECTQCKEWIHLKCSRFESYKEARENKDSYICANCEKGNEAPEKSKNDYHPKCQDGDSIEESKSNENIFENKGFDIEERDVETLMEGKWLNDKVLSFAFEDMQQKHGSKDKKMIFVNPIITQLIKVSTDEKDINKAIDDIGLRKADWVFLPVNDNHTDKEGGSHWSLLVYSRNENTFYHFDPIFGMNDGSITMLIKKLIDNGNKIPEVKYVICPRQSNGYDCGPYTLMFAEKVAENIEAGIELTKIRNCDATEYRMKLQKKIEGKIKPSENKSKENKNKESDEKKEEEKKVPNRKEEDKKELKKQDRKKECWYYTNKECKFGDRCKDEHREQCRETIENGYCFDNNCRLGHPIICRDIYETGRCKRLYAGIVCRYFHPINLRNRNNNNQYNRRHEFEEINGGTDNKRQNNSYQRDGMTNTRQQNNYDRWDRTREQNVHFLENQSQDRRDMMEQNVHFLENRSRDWRDVMEPIMERAMEALSERMWDKYRRGTDVNHYHGK